MSVWVILIGSIVLLGWVFGLPGVASILPGLATMKFNTALCFVLAGTALWLQLQSSALQTRFFSLGCALAVIALALLTLAEYGFDWNLYIDELVIRDLATSPEIVPPGRMSLATASCFLLLGLALLLLDVEFGDRFRPAQYLALLGTLAGLIGCQGYLFGITSLYQFFPYSSMAVHTALLFVALGLGVLLARPDRALMATVTSGNLGGVMARRLLPAAIILPMVIAWLRLEGERAGFYETEIGVALIVTASVIAFCAAIWLSSSLLNRLHERLKQRNRLYAVLSQCNQTVVYVKDRERLFAEVCRIAVEIGGFRMAWIGLADRRTATLQPVAHAGEEGGYLAKTRFTFRDEPAGHDPAGTAIREGRHVVCNDVRRDALMAPWREVALAHGCYAAAAFPILLDGKTIGALCVHSASANYFDDEELRLLDEIVMDISLGLRQIELERMRGEAERTMAYLAAIVEFSNDAIISKDLNGVVTSWNTGAESIFGYSADEMVGQFITRLIPPALQNEETYILSEVRDGRRIVNLETVRVRKDGRLINVAITVSPIKDFSGKVIGVSKIARDIAALKRAQENLNASLKELGEFKAALDEHAIVAITDPQGKIGYVNDKFCAISQYSRAELLGQDHRIINSGYHPPAFMRALWTTIAQGKVWHGQLRNRAKDGSIYWVDTTIVPFLDPQGKPRQYIAIRADITQLKRYEENLKASLKEVTDLKTALDEHGIVAITDNKGMITYVNDKFCAVTHYSREELLGRDHSVVKSGHHTEEFYKSMWDTLGQGRVWQGEIKNKTKDGRYFWSQTTIVPFLDNQGKPRQYVAISADITDRQLAQEMLLSRTEELARSNKDLEQFAYAASHDLQEPLRAVAGCVELLQRRYQGQIDAKADEYIAHAVDGAHRMQKLINDLLEYARVGTRGSGFQDVDCAEVVKAAISNLALAIQESGAVITRDDLPILQGDAAQLTVLFQNLIGNAIKFRGDHPPHIHLSAKREGMDWILAIQDNGIGIDPKYFERVFGVFQRLHTRREYPGTGIGLALCRRIMDRHRGSIWVQSEPGQGSIFFCRFRAMVS